jgi:hypothetical protein
VRCLIWFSRPSNQSSAWVLHAKRIEVASGCTSPGAITAWPTKVAPGCFSPGAICRPCPVGPARFVG